jgi:hypothetical protein
VDNIKEYVDKYVTLQKPVPLYGLQIKPVLVRDFFQFNSAKDVLNIEKNKIPNIDIIQMTYLRFLLMMMLEQDEFKEDFLTILALSLGVKYDATKRNPSFEPNEILTQQARKDEVEVWINGWDVRFRLSDSKVILCLYDDENLVEIDDAQFDELRKIILLQNIYKYDDTEMSDDFRRVVEEYYRLKNKDIVLPTLEDRLMAVCISSAYKLEELYVMPLRLFDALLERSIDKLEYQVNKLIVNLAQGKVEGFNLSHWVYKTKKDKYSEIFTDAQDLVKKVTSI